MAGKAVRLDGALWQAKQLARRGERVAEVPMIYGTSTTRVQEFLYRDASKNLVGIAFIQPLGRPLVDRQRAREAARIGAIRQVLWLSSHRQMTERLVRWESERQGLLDGIMRAVEANGHIPATASEELRRLRDLNGTLQQLSQKILLYSTLYLRGYKANQHAHEVSLGSLEESLSHLTMLLSTLQQRYRRTYEFYETVRDIEATLTEQGHTGFPWRRNIVRLRRLDAREQRYLTSDTGDDLRQRILDLTEGRLQCWQEKLPGAEAMFKERRRGTMENG